MIVFPSKKSYVTTATANAWVAISGTNGETPQVPIPKDSMDFIVTVSILHILIVMPHSAVKFRFQNTVAFFLA